MPVRPIVITGSEVLHTPAKPVEKFDEALQSLIEDMYLTMDKAPGVGLAAPQIGVPLRVFVYDYDDEHGNPRRGVIVNPELELGPLPDGQADWDTESEGCLSVPGERFPLKRAQSATCRGFDAAGNPIVIAAEGWFARIFQHEFDHLNGTLYVDRLAEPHKSDAAKIVIANDWGRPGLSWLPGVDNLEG